ncbi:MAG: hypothetical protein Q4A74_01645 [Cardiobacteriaceae bacterium]|nr:hypothetical protein [Cardiobacteriaceae bacterium]
MALSSEDRRNISPESTQDVKNEEQTIEEQISYAASSDKSDVSLSTNQASPQKGYHQAIRAETREQYERRIDELFSGRQANLKGVNIIDRSDVLDMLGYGDIPVQLDESKVVLNQTNHPEMTADIWKKIPEWLENPAAVLQSRTHDKRLVFIPEETINNAPIYVVVEPNKKGLKVHALVNSYAKDGNPTQAMRDIANDLRKGNVQYVDKGKARDLLERSGLQLPGVPNLNTGCKKILTEKNLAGYRKNTASLKQNSSAQNPVLERGSFLPDSNTIVLTPHANLSTFIHETGHFFFETLTKMARQLRTKADAGETLTASQQQIVQDADTLLAHVGFDYEKWDASDLETRREAHEKAALQHQEAISALNAQRERSNLQHQADIARVNANLATLGKVAARAAGDHSIARYSLQAGNARASARAGLAANGVVLDEGSTQELMQTADLMRSIDIHSLQSNALNEAFGYENRAQDLLNQAALAEANKATVHGQYFGSAGVRTEYNAPQDMSRYVTRTPVTATPQMSIAKSSISPLMAATSTLIGGASALAPVWNSLSSKFSGGGGLYKQMGFGSSAVKSAAASSRLIWS